MSDLIEYVVKDVIEKIQNKVQKALDLVRAELNQRIDDIEVPTPDITHLEQRVEDAIKAIPEVKDGVDGKDGVAPTADEVAKSMEGLFAKWALDFERKAHDTLQKACEKIPKPKDAFELEDFDISLGDDQRTITISFKKGEEVIQKSIKLSVPIYKDVYRDAEDYSKGDVVTFGGSAWTCLKDAPEGKPGQTEDWRLTVKRGRDGRESVKIEKQIDKVKVE